MGIYGQCHERYCFVTLTFNFKVTGGLLKVRFWPFFHILAQFSNEDLGLLLQGQTRIAKLKTAYNSLIIGPRGLG